MSKKLYVGNLPYSIDDDSLKELFAEYSSIDSCKLIRDRDTGRSKGFGFVEFSDDAVADKAIEDLNGTEIDGRAIIVNEARPQEKRERSFDRRRF